MPRQEPKDREVFEGNVPGWGVWRLVGTWGEVRGRADLSRKDMGPGIAILTQVGSPVVPEVLGTASFHLE